MEVEPSDADSKAFPPIEDSHAPHAPSVFTLVTENQVLPRYSGAFFCPVDDSLKTVVAYCQSRIDVFDLEEGALTFRQSFEFFYPIRQVDVLKVGKEIELLIVFSQNMVQIARYSARSLLMRDVFKINGNKIWKNPFRMGGLAGVTSPVRFNDSRLIR
jgi:hypothetical protein